MQEETSEKEIEKLRRQVGELEKIREEFEKLKAQYQTEIARFNRITNNMLDAVAEVDMEGRLLYLSPSHERIFGFKPEERLGKNVYAFIHPGDAAIVKNVMRECLAKREPGQVEFRYLLGNGNYCRVESVSSFVPDECGQIAGLLVSTRSVEERRKVEDDIRRSEEKFRKLAEASSVGIAIVDGERFVYVNPMTRRMSGFTEEEYLSRPLWDFVTPEARDLIMKRAQDRMAGKPVPDRYEISVMTKDGQIKWAEVGATLTEYNGKPATIFTLYDITSRKTAEAERTSLQEQLNRARKREAIGALAAGIAHDFNNILSGIQGHCSLMQFQISAEDPNGKHLQGINNQVHSGAHLTRQLLGMASGETYVLKPTDMNDVIRESSDVFSRARKGIAITRRLEENIWPVEANVGQIDQVLLNLFINAAQAMNNEGDLYLETRNLELGEEDERPFGMKPGRYVRIDVTDTGTGMDKETAEKAFEPFFTTKGKGQGTGLGLATAYGIVKNHRGYIMINSAPGAGTTFHLYFPATQNAVEEKSDPARTLVRGRETILLVDDEAIIAETTKEVLEMLGYRTLLAGSGQEGVAVFMEKGASIDLVILDMVMPGMGGSKVFETLRGLNPGIRIILYSGYFINNEIQALLDRGGCGFIQKPFNIEEFSAKIRDILDRT